MLLPNSRCLTRSFDSVEKFFLIFLQRAQALLQKAALGFPLSEIQRLLIAEARFL